MATFDSKIKALNAQQNMSLSVDASDLAKVAKVLKQLGYDQRNWVLAKALNRTADATRTVVKQRVGQKGGIKSGAIKRHMKTRRANSQNLEYTLWGYGKGLKVTAGKGANNGNFKSARWNRKWSGARWSGPEKEKNHAFMIKPEGRNTFRKHGGQLKEGVVMTRKGKGRLPLKVEFDDGVGKLMIESQPERIADLKMKTVFVERVFHEAEQGLLHGKHKYNLI